ncbi:hypothetical protein OKW41_003777 [Paraburkholderia sp. UCT70]
MEKNVANNDGKAATSNPSGHRSDRTSGETAAAPNRGQPATEREPQQRGRLKKPRESLHAWIVHFDAEPSSGPPASNDED